MLLALALNNLFKRGPIGEFLHKWLVVIHPLLFALFFVLAFYSANITEASFSEIWIPLFASLGFAFLMLLIVFLLIGLILKLQKPPESSQPYRIWDIKKAAIIASIIIILSFTYGHILAALGGEVSVFSALLPIIWLVLFIVGGYFIAKTRRDLRKPTVVLNIVAVALVIVPIVGIITSQITSSQQYSNEAGNTETPVVDLVKPDTPPDIYYIILDRYASASTLEEVYGYDNGEFIDYLSNKGFYVANESQANYSTTYDSLPSSLNLDFLHEEIDGELVRVHPWQPMFQDYTVWRSLKEVGYQFVHFGSLYEATGRNSYADINYNSYWLPEFTMRFFQTTLMYYFSVAFNIIDDTNELQYENVLYTFENLSKIPGIKEPTYVFAHMLIPHHPYVFDREGNFQTLNEANVKSETDNYIDQLIAANNMLMELIDELLMSSEVPPIIIIQADEGPYPGGQEKWEATRYGWEEATAAELRQKMGILNAYYLPNTDQDGLYPSITPVNSFRQVFNLYFGTDLELLPDNSYARQWDNHNKFFDITDKLEYD